MLALRYEDIIRPKAKDNLVKAGETGGRGQKPCQNSDNPIIPIDTKKEIAKIAGVSHDTIHAHCPACVKITQGITPNAHALLANTPQGARNGAD